MRNSTTGLAVIGVGAAVALMGATLLRGNARAGVAGFGLAHVVLGGLDMLRPGTAHDNYDHHEEV
ncbi:MAG: hypothetical protein ACYC2T_07285 [Bacillota bacterium]